MAASPVSPARPVLAALGPRHVLLDLDAEHEVHAIRSVAARLHGHPDVSDAALLADEMVQRERISSTALGNGVAFAHARTPTVRGLVLAVGCSPGGVLFRASRQRVHLLFAIGTPPDYTAQYLHFVGTLARQLKSEEFRRQLVAAPSPEDFVGLLRGDLVTT